MRRLEKTGSLIIYCSKQICAEQSCECWPMCNSTQKRFEEMTDKELEQCYNLAFGTRKEKNKMAMAKKCDRCGKLYEGYQIKDDDEGTNGIAEVGIGITDRYMVKKVYDLCPECEKSFEKRRDNK